MAKRKQRVPADTSFFSTPRRYAKAGTRSGLKASKFELVTRSIQHGEILPASITVAAGCLGKKSSNNPNGQPRRDQVELVFLKRGMTGHPPGPALRFCTAKGKGEFLPVKGPHEAKAIAQKYQRCMKKSNAKACIAKVR